MPISERVQTSLTGKAFWPMLNKVDKFGKFKIDLVVEGDELKKAQDLGIAIQTPEPGAAQTGPYITFRVAQKDERKDIPADKRRPDLEKVPTTMADGTEPKDLIGNGSDVTVEFAAGPYVFKGKFGIYATLLNVKVNTLVAYKKSA